MIQEQWKPIKGYEGLYEISNLARVKRLARKFVDCNGRPGGVSECIMKISTDDKFPVVNLMKDNKYHREDLCMLMKTNWMGLEWYQVVDYIDGDRWNCKLDNLKLHEQENFVDGEEWRDVKGYEGLYQVSSKGRLRSVDRYVRLSNGRLRLFRGTVRTPDDKDGYSQYCLYDQEHKDKPKSFVVHRLVAQAFIPNPDNLPEVNHKDGNKSNNCVDNLEWITKSGNVRHAYDHGLIDIDKVRAGLYKGSMISKERTSIRCYCIETGEEYDSYSDAGRKTGTSASEIKSSCDDGSAVHGLHYARVGETSKHVEIKDLPGEIWKAVPGYEGIYVISNLKRMKRLQGVCKTKTSVRTVPEKLIVTKYTNVSLNKDGEAELVNFKNLWSSIFDHKSSKKLF